LQVNRPGAFSRRDTTEERDAALIEIRLWRGLIAMNGHLLEALTQSNAPGALAEGGLRQIMAAPNPVSLNAHFAGRPNRCRRASTSRCRQPRDVF